MAVEVVLFLVVEDCLVLNLLIHGTHYVQMKDMVGITKAVPYQCNTCKALTQRVLMTATPH